MSRRASVIMPSRTQDSHMYREISAVQGTLNVLRAAGIRFLRLRCTDSNGLIRCKSIVIGKNTTAEGLIQGANFVECMLGLVLKHDAIAPNSGLSSSGILLLQPDFQTLNLLPSVFGKNQAAVFGTLVDPATGEPSDLCPRETLRHSVAKAQADGYCFTVGVEVEFQILPVDGGHTHNENWAQSGRLTEHADFLGDLEDVLRLQEIEIEMIHAEAATGQIEAVLHYTDPLAIADRVMVFRESLQAVARKHNISATMAPKISELTAGSGMHMHFGITDPSGQSLLGGDTDSKYGLSQTGQSAMAGILHHLPALVALTTPSTNSFKRLAPGTWSGAYIVWGEENKECPLRLCTGAPRRTTGMAKVEHFELKTVDATANPYLALTGVLAAIMDGISNQHELPEPTVGDPASRVPLPAMLPQSLQEAIDALEKNDVISGAMGERLKRSYLAVKRVATECSGSCSEEAELLMSKGI